MRRSTRNCRRTISYYNAVDPLAPLFDPVGNHPQQRGRGRPRGRPRLNGVNRAVRARGVNQGAAPRRARGRGQRQPIVVNNSSSESEVDEEKQQFRRNLEELFENEHARFLARWRERDERERIRQLDFDHPERDHIVAPNNAPANVNLFADADPVILADPCTICFAEEANYGLDRCIHRFCLTCIRRFQPQVCPVCRRALFLIWSRMHFLFQ